MERRLYPDLDPFYKFSNVEYGAEDECVPDYPKLEDEEEDVKIHETNSKRYFMDSEETLPRRVPITPSAPPLTDGGASLLESLYSYIMEELEPPPYSPNDPLSRIDGDSTTTTTTWTDDLQPDYDISGDDVTEVVVPEINNLSVSVGNNDNDTNVISRAENNSGETMMIRRVGSATAAVVENEKHTVEQQHSCHRNRTAMTTIHNNNNDRSKNKDNDRGAKNTQCNNPNDMVIVTNRNLEASDQHAPAGRRGKMNTEYGAWVTWRKNVNKQLATVILLRRGGHVHLQKSDLSRRPLSRTSMDYVIRNARKCNGNGGMGSSNNIGNSKGGGGGGGNVQGTSLNGTPYIMYGIPRVALSKNR